MPRRILQGRVVSAKCDKTVIVLVERRFMHPLYKKFIRRTKRFAAHDELNTCQEGDRVRIRECRPISKRKCWEVFVPEQDETAAGVSVQADSGIGSGVGAGAADAAGAAT